MSLLQYSEDQILDRLRFENPWWISKAVDSFYATMEPRPYFVRFLPLVLLSNIRRAVVLMGPRRIGKTVMLYHTVQELLRRGVDPLKIVFVAIDAPIYNGIPLDEIFASARRATAKSDANGWYVFFDEIQYLKGWEIHLKRLVDDYPNTKFVVSGSAAAALKLKSNESGAGRFTDFMLPPPTFSEFIHMKNLDHLVVQDAKYTRISRYGTNDISEFNRRFLEYINIGGFPEIYWNPAIQADPGRYIASDILEKVLLRDLPSLYGIRDVQELNSLFTTLAFNTGNEISLEELSKRSGVDKTTIKRYIEYLEAAFLIRVIKPLKETSKRFQRSHQFKVYLTNTTLRSALFGPMDANSDLLGHMVETTIFAQWLHRSSVNLHYARWKTGGGGEVDMVQLSDTLQPIWALEVKWSNRYFDAPNELGSLVKFCKLNGLNTAWTTTINKEGFRDVDGVRINFLPASTYAYSVGRNALDLESPEPMS